MSDTRKVAGVPPAFQTLLDEQTRREVDRLFDRVTRTIEELQ